MDAIGIAQKLRDSGICAICSWCERLWKAYDVSNASYCGRKDCGGPLLKRSFPKYKGPWNNKSLFCFICGNKSDHGVQVGKDGIIGVCEKHYDMMLKMLKDGTGNVKIREENARVIE